MCISKNTSHYFPSRLLGFRMLGALSSGLTHCFNPSRDSGVQWWIHVSSMVTNRYKSTFVLRLKQDKFCSEVVTRMRFWSIGSNRGTHLAQSFLIHKCVCKTFTTHSFKMNMISATSRTFTFWSFKKISWVLLIFSDVITSFRRPRLGMVFVLVRPQ